MARPLIGVVCDVTKIGKHLFHKAGEKYIAAVADGAGGLPLLIPALPEPLPADEVLDRLDGLLFTGALSNVHPNRYGGPAPRPGTLEDLQRDETSLNLIPAAIERGVPLFCICRGFQELNVALGGTLFAHLHEQPGRQDHRENNDDPVEVQYGPAHEIVLSGTLRDIVGKDRMMVNSLHGQGVDRLAPTLEAEGVAPDGTVEAVRVKGARAFAMGAQWHPEWKVKENPDYLAIFQAFGAACADHASKRRG